jgi:hypothetical protein
MWIVMDIESGEGIKDTSCLVKVFCNYEQCKEYFNNVKKNINELSKEIGGEIIEIDNSIELNSDVLFKKIEMNELKCINVISG